MNHHPTLMTMKSAQSRCGQWVDRVAHANTAEPVTCPECLALLAAKAETFETVVKAYVDEQQSHADRYYADFFVTLSDELLAIGLANIEADIAWLPYASLTTNIADRGAGLRDEQRRFMAEIERRSSLGSYGKRRA